MKKLITLLMIMSLPMIGFAQKECTKCNTNVVIDLTETNEYLSDVNNGVWKGANAQQQILAEAMRHNQVVEAQNAKLIKVGRTGNLINGVNAGFNGVTAVYTVLGYYDKNKNSGQQVDIFHSSTNIKDSYNNTSTTNTSTTNTTTTTSTTNNPGGTGDTGGTSDPGDTGGDTGGGVGHNPNGGRQAPLGGRMQTQNAGNIRSFL